MRMIHCMLLCCASLVIWLYSNTIIIYALRHVNYLRCFSSRGDTSGACPTRGGRCTWGCTRRWYFFVKHVKNTQFEVGSWLVADFEWLYFVGQVWHGELNGSVLVNYLHQVVRRLNRCIWYAPCRRLIQNFPRGHFHAGGGGTVSNSVWLCVFCLLTSVHLWSSEYKKGNFYNSYNNSITIKSIISRTYNTFWLPSHCVVCPYITLFSMPSKRRRKLFNTNKNCIFRNYQIS